MIKIFGILLIPIKVLLKKTGKQDWLPFLIIFFGMGMVVAVGLSKNNWNTINKLIAEQQVIEEVVSQAPPVAAMAPINKAENIAPTTESTCVIVQPHVDEKKNNITDILYALTQLIIGIFSLLIAYLTKVNTLRNESKK